jgi:hypothetical protein
MVTSARAGTAAPIANVNPNAHAAERLLNE